MEGGLRPMCGSSLSDEPHVLIRPDRPPAEKRFRVFVTSLANPNETPYMLGDYVRLASAVYAMGYWTGFDLANYPEDLYTYWIESYRGDGEWRVLNIETSE